MLAAPAEAPVGVVLLLEHEPVFTLGKRGRIADVPGEGAASGAGEADIAVHRSPRGGQATYHGPGQLVAYPIVNLRAARIGARSYVESLERAIVRTCETFGVANAYPGSAASDGATKTPGALTGVWIPSDDPSAAPRKVAAVGVRISRGVATHGLALNVANDLAPFERIVPCGLPGAQATSLAAEAARTAAGPTVAGVRGALLSHLCDELGATLVAEDAWGPAMGGLVGEARRAGGAWAAFGADEEDDMARL